MAQEAPENAVEEYLEISPTDPGGELLKAEIKKVLNDHPDDRELAELAAQLGQYVPNYDVNYRGYLQQSLRCLEK